MWHFQTNLNRNPNVTCSGPVDVFSIGYHGDIAKFKKARRATHQSVFAVHSLRPTENIWKTVKD